MNGGDDDITYCTLTEDEFFELPDGPYQRAPNADLQLIAGRDRLPVPPSLSGLKPTEIYRQFVIGDSPLPDLAAAEYIRRELQFLAHGWITDERQLHQDDLVAAKAELVRHRDANLRAATIWVIAKGDLGQRGLIKKATVAINAVESRAIKFGWPEATNDRQRTERNRKVAQLVKDLRRSAVPGERPFLLSAADFSAVENWFAFDDLDLDAEQF